MARRFLFGAWLAWASWMLLADSRAWADDTDLVRTNGSKPYVLFILDTSTSMNLELGTDRWHPLNGDWENSRIFRAKRALYEVMRDIDSIHFGLMTYNQDELRVRSKHWVYAATEAPGSSWPLDYPLPDPNGVLEPGDDVFTLGKHFDPGPLGPFEPGVAASCEAPLDLSDPVDRARANRFAKLGASGTQTTVLWVRQPVGAGGGAFRLEVSAPAIATGFEVLGARMLTLRLTARRVGNCEAFERGEGVPNVPFVETLEFRRLGEFLMADAGDDFVDRTSLNEEGFAGFWNWEDVASGTVCAEDSPFTGKGMDSNYDDPGLLPPFTPPAFKQAERDLLTGDDQHCVVTPAGEVCENLKFSTRVDSVYPEFRELDRGDFIPYHWKISAKDAFLQRLNPRHLTGGAPEYGVAPYFNDVANPITQTLALGNARQRPLVASGPSPLGKAVNDYRCWYLGPLAKPKSKCRIGNSKLAFETGWEEVAAGRDPDFACRSINVVIISDGEDSCGGENVTADINDFERNGVRTWIINVGDDRAAQSFQSIIATTKAELINLAEEPPVPVASAPAQAAPFPSRRFARAVSTAPAAAPRAAAAVSTAPTLGGANPVDRLADALRDILGEINSDTRAFTAAAVPSVQTEADDKIIVSSFRPLQDSAVWAGSALAFLKPLPTKEEPAGSGRFVPDTSTPCSATRRSECFLWDAGEVLKTQVNLADPVGPAVTQRRVFYSAERAGASVPLERRPLEDAGASGGSTPSERDLWRGLGVAFREGDPASESQARSEARAILDETYSIKTARLNPDDATTEIEFLLGDTFHADPVLVGGPASNQLFAQDYENYRDFAVKHRYRRKLLITAANDGMLHFFDAGVAEVVANEVRFGNGTGREVAAYVPRAVMPKLQQLAGGKTHTWSVDGSLSIADMYLDPVHGGVPEVSDREWRTVLVAGLRRGGEAVYAIDITQPDELEEKTLPGPPAQTVVVPKNPQSIPDCHDRLGATSSELACDAELPFPSPLWEFRDTVEIGGTRYRLDEDDNGEFDLAFTWSRPNLGRIQVEEDGEIVDKFVAVFGGGLDPGLSNQRGDWLYIVDLETGEAIYKQRLANPYNPALSGGAAASEPAAVDTNQDGLLDRVYIGTTGGFIYRIDLGPDGEGNLPELGSYPLLVEVQPGQFQIAADVRRITDRAPRVVFDNIRADTNRRLPFFFRPSVVFTPLLAPSYALALGDGDREDLWSSAPAPGRFYLFADDTDERPGIITSAQLEAAPVGLAIGDALFNPKLENRNGWVLDLAASERVVSEAFALSGITVFSTYLPDPPTVSAPDAEDEDGPNRCSRTGRSQVFAVLTTNGNGVLFDAAGNRTRSIGVETLVGRAFADLSATQNRAPGDSSGPAAPEPLPPNRQLILEELKKLFPPNCRFANYRIDVRAVASDTRLVEVAPVPVCVVQKNWREF